MRFSCRGEPDTKRFFTATCLFFYFRYLKDFLSIGPPMYFVVKGGLNYSDTKTQNLICGGQYCDVDSLITQVYTASRMENSTYIARPSSSWLDDYFDWSASPSCCKFNKKDGSFCPHTSCKYNFFLFFISL